ncbi:hypothetical protein KCU64_g13013, partial [Aureobasidium melanogenum]
AGTLKINGVVKDMKKYKKLVGMVPQDDIVFPELTVRENILHSARMRLPSSWNDRAIQDYVDSLVACLTLTHVQNSLVGDARKPVISGGQRKRVNIGIELAAAPMAVFLDEPTSGLDATSAASIMRLLKAISRLGVTVIAVVHQPREDIFVAFDQLLLLAKGNQVYAGATKDVVSYFEDLGYHFPLRSNPADIIMDVITGNGKQYSSQSEKFGSDTDLLIKFWYENGRFGKSNKRLTGHWSLGIFFQRVSILRHLSPAVHPNVKCCKLQISSSACMAIGLASSAPGVWVFGEEVLMFQRESSSGHSKSAYYVGKVLSTLPRITIAALHYTVMIGVLATPLISFQDMYAANLLYFYAIYGLSSVVSMLVKREDGPLLAVLLSLVLGVLGGVAPPLSKVKEWHMEWFWRLSPGVWFTEAYWTKMVSPMAYLWDVELATQTVGFNLGEFGKDLALIFVIGTVYRMLAYALLVLFRKRRR